VEHTAMKITTDGTITLRIKAAGAKPEEITASKWTLPGMTVAVQGDTAGFAVKESAYYKDGDSFAITYSNVHQLTLTVTPQ
jgi:hypothetical protein